MFRFPFKCSAKTRVANDFCKKEEYELFENSTLEEKIEE
jgi:hypothetical protein